MNENLLLPTLLFRGIKKEELSTVLTCLSPVTKTFQKGEIIFHIGDVIHDIGVVLSGGVYLEHIDIWGNTTILDHIGTGQIFAEAYACSLSEPSMINVIAAANSEILFLNTARVLKTCSNACIYHSRIIQNLLMISAQRNLNLSKRIFHTTPKSIRAKVLSYLSSQAIKLGKYEFKIPFNRQQLADYLGVDRSALSSELSKMQREGIIEYEKNYFRLKQNP
ncbi:MAG: Crp/Fnr family transcriptional regulator [Lachnospiraceae bacterium]